ncbi:MAG TPA: methyltransferase domain-containing protein [Verrucomicrobiae bacterium]|nr:methyltransferase domain-containing protein [Verrucomicrobiae bacterium]
MSTHSIQTGGVPALKLTVKAEREVAYDSPDHLMPWGTRVNNSTNLRFLTKVINLFPPQAVPRILDMGCAGGAFVKDCLDAGCLAMGLEGSDYSRRFRRAEWRSIPEFLFTCDITRDFQIECETGGEPVKALKFDIVTSWEVMEHIATKDIPALAANVKKHLAPEGLWIMSIASGPDVIGGVDLHQTVKPKAWWVETFKAAGLEHREEYINYFNTQWVRGPKYGSIGSFHVVVSHTGAKLAPLPKENPLLRLYDLWLGTLAQKFIAGSFIRR